MAQQPQSEIRVGSPYTGLTVCHDFVSRFHSGFAVEFAQGFRIEEDGFLSGAV